MKYRYLFLITMIVFFVLAVKIEKDDVFVDSYSPICSKITEIKEVTIYQKGNTKTINLPKNMKTSDVYYMKIFLDEKIDLSYKVIDLYFYYSDIECFIDGKNIYSYKINEKNTIKSGSRKHHHLHLPMNIKNPEILIKVTPKLSGSIEHKVHKIYIADGITLMKKYIKDDFLKYIFIILLFCVFLGANIFNIITLKKDKFSNEVFNFSLVCFFICAYMFTQTKTCHVLSNSHIYLLCIYIIEFSSLAFFLIPIIEIIKIELDPKFKKILNFSSVMLTINALLQNILTVFTPYEFVHMLRITHTLILFTLISIFTSFCFTSSKKYPGKTKLLFSYIPLIITFFTGILTYYADIKFSYKDFLMLGVILFVGIQAFFITMEYKSMYKNLIEKETYKKIAMIDIMTNLKNRYAFNKKLDWYNLNKSLYKSIGIIIIDMNNLKLINDNIGHSAGDLHIIKMGNTLKEYAKVFPYSDIFRIGGDEFIILIKDISEESLNASVRTLSSLNNKSYISEGKEIINSFSFGCHFYTSSAEKSLKDAIHEADKKMYQYKKEMKENS